VRKLLRFPQPKADVKPAGKKVSPPAKPKLHALASLPSLSGIAAREIRRALRELRRGHNVAAYTRLDALVAAKPSSGPATIKQ
jgi:hypothetical protein